MSASAVTSPTIVARSEMPNSSCSIAGSGGSPTPRSEVMRSSSEGSRPSTRGRPSGPVMRSSTKSGHVDPVTRSISSPSTQWAEVGWYS